MSAVSDGLENPAPADGPGRRRTLLRNLLVAGGIAAVFLVAIFFIVRFVGSERERELAQWRARLSIVADTRQEAVAGRMRREYRTFRRLAANQTLGIYIGAILAAKGDDSPPEADFLRNLLRATAARAGYAAGVSGNLPANVTQHRPAGLAIVTPEGKTIVATRGMPALKGRFRQFVLGLKKPGIHLYDLTPETGQGDRSHVVMGFAAVIRGPQATPLALVVGIKPIGEDLYPLLKQPGDQAESAEVYLVRLSGNTVEYISPLRAGGKPFSLRLPKDTPGLVAAMALASTASDAGQFLRGRDYNGTDVLAVSRRVPTTPWALVYKIDVDDALAASDARLSRLLIILLLALGLVIIAFLALWRHGASRQAALRASTYREVAEELAEQRNLLRVVTDNQPDAIYIVDDSDMIRFANTTAAAGSGAAPDALGGRPLTALFSPQKARRVERLNRQAVEAAKPVLDIYRIGDQNGGQIVQSRHVPLPGQGDLARSVLVVEEDITNTVRERERRERNLHSLVESLVTMVDRRDPNAARHSVRVARVARAIAGEMGLDRRLVETARMAGDLMNIGKLMAPPDLLTKPEKLNEEEFAEVRAAIDNAPDLLQGIDFDGPVVDTLRQARERWDGSGRPNGLKGEQILITARIVAVADAFVALGSPRAHRPAQDIDGALAALQSEAGQAYDRKVVTALVNYMDNRGGREEWSQDQQEPSADPGGD